MIRKIYLSPFGFFISLILNLLGRLARPFMVYGYWDGNAMKVRKTVRFSSSTTFVGGRKKLEVGDNCWIGHHSIIDSSNGVHIGEGVQIAGLNGIYSHSSHIAIRLMGRDYMNAHHTQRIGYVKGAVTIGDYSFIGAGAIILPGVTIGKGCIIGAGAIVNSNIPDFSIAVGTPAKVVGSVIELDKPYFSDEYVREHYFAKTAMS
jgi:acetyltransferase-like isoleucine patch superfamily enzyme